MYDQITTADGVKGKVLQVALQHEERAGLYIRGSRMDSL